MKGVETAKYGLESTLEQSEQLWKWLISSRPRPKPRIWALTVGVRQLTLPKSENSLVLGFVARPSFGLGEIRGPSMTHLFSRFCVVPSPCAQRASSAAATRGRHSPIHEGTWWGPKLGILPPWVVSTDFLMVANGCKEN